MIDQLLTVSKLDAQSLSLKVAELNVSDAVAAITSQFSSLAQDKKINLEFTSSAPEITAFVDLEKLHIMVNNLISNALKFTGAGGQIKVSVGSTHPGKHNGDYASDQYLTITVADTGHGIPANELEYVFDRFFQSPSSAHAGSGVGTGIGLSLVKDLAKLHSGTINVSSTHQQSIDAMSATSQQSGTKFELILPLGNAHLNPSEIVDPMALLQSSSDELLEASTAEEQSNDLARQDLVSQVEPPASATILVVDDNDEMRSYIRGILESQYNIVEAINGIDGEQQLTKCTPDMILTDLMMPKRDGLEFVQSIKQNNSYAHIPIIMLTAKAGHQARLKGLMAAVDDYITKPFDAAELKVRIKNLLVKQAQFKAFYQIDNPNGKSLNQLEAHTADDQYLAKLRSIIEQHIKNPEFGVNQLADQLHVSRATLSRQLKSKYDFTPSQFIRQCRLEKARKLSLQGNIKTLNELSYAVGFSQAAYFSKLYQKAFNAPPIET